MAKVQLTGDNAAGKSATVDDADYENVARYNWYMSSAGYACRNLWLKGQGRATTVYLHRVVMQPPQGITVDHKNGDRLDNRRSNLRLATVGENRRNSGLRSNNTSGYAGVHLFKQKVNNRWQARIADPSGKRIGLGFFATPEEAASAWNEAASSYYGEFARLNEIPAQRAS